ncbi:hypothetical protein D3C83_304520 [compost metagenome]
MQRIDVWRAERAAHWTNLGISVVHDDFGVLVLVNVSDDRALIPGGRGAVR